MKCSNKKCSHKGEEQQETAFIEIRTGKQTKRCEDCRRSPREYYRRSFGVKKKYTESVRLHRFVYAQTRGFSSVRTFRNDLFGCTRDDLKIHIESQFLPGMGWGIKDSFHIDHHIPKTAGFDLTNISHLKVLNHFSNLVVMTPKANMQKSDKLPLGFNFEEYYHLKKKELS